MAKVKISELTAKGSSLAQITLTTVFIQTFSH